MDRGSVTMTNKIRLKWKPCLVEQKYFKFVSFVLTPAQGDMYNILTYKRHFPPNSDFFQQCQTLFILQCNKSIMQAHELVVML